MKRWIQSALALAVVAVAVGFLLPYVRKERNGREVDINDPTLIKQGEYIARLADCVACHTPLGGEPYAGGLAMPTPLGMIYSTNITPDQETGIGNYTFEQFNNAVRHGIRADNKALYPAMPYPSYQIMSEDEMAAMYAYFMKGVKAVHLENKPSELPPVLNWRFPLAYWQWFFSPKREFVAEHSDKALSRGQYLVEGAGHCGSCHTERGIGFQEKALSNTSTDYLGGAVIDGWRAKSLRGEAHGLGRWSEAELVDFFKTGRTHHTAAFGAMAEVVEHSTQYWTDEDLQAMAKYLKTLSPLPNHEIELKPSEDKTTAMLLDGKYDSRGAMLYAEYCQVCHRADGKGIPRIFPALAGNSAVIAEQPESVLQITLSGGRMPLTKHDAMAFAMPEFSQLSDADVAAVVNFIRNSWGYESKTIDIEDVVKMRQFLRQKPKTSTDIPQNLHATHVGGSS